MNETVYRKAYKTQQFYLIYSAPGGGGTPLHKLYRHVGPQTVWFLSLFGLKQDIDFDHFGLRWGEVCARGGTPLYKLYWYVRRQRVWFLSLYGLK